MAEYLTPGLADKIAALTTGQSLQAYVGNDDAGVVVALAAAAAVNVTAAVVTGSTITITLTRP